MPANVRIDIKALQHNYNLLRKRLGSIFCVLKANAYGHGLEECGPALAEYGASCFAVAEIDEAIALKSRLKERGSNSPDILILGHTAPEHAVILAENRFIQTVYSAEYAEELKSFGVRLRTHIKLDTGMNRLGFRTDSEELAEIAKVYKNSKLVPEGIYTHFSCADMTDAISRDFTKEQYRRYISAVSELDSLGISPKLKHVCNTAAAIRYPEMRLDAVRIGLALYGLVPNVDISFSGLLPVMSFCAPIVSVHRAEVGEAVGYGGSYVCKKRTYIATVSAGYGDGFLRSYAGHACPLLLESGFGAKVIGNVCMDQLMLDITDAVERGCNVKCGSEVELFSAAGSAKNSISALARSVGTISYEIASCVSARAKRIYIR